MVRWSRCSRGKGGSNYIITMVEEDPKSYCDSESPMGMSRKMTRAES